MQQDGNKYFTHRPPPPTLGVKKVKIQLFQNMATLHIKLKGITNATIWQQIFCLHTSPPPPTLGVIIRLFQNMVMLHYQIKWNHDCSNMVAIFFRHISNPHPNMPPAPPPPPTHTHAPKSGNDVKGSKFNCRESRMQ